MRRSVLVFYFFSLFIAFQVSGQDSSKTILFFGNSLTAGLGLDPVQAFPHLVGQKIKEHQYDYTVVSSGLSGETSAGGLARIDWVLRRPVDIFVLELGANDGLRGLPLSATRSNLQKIIDKVKTKYPSAKIVIAGMMVPPNIGVDYSQEFVKLYTELASKNKATLIPFLLDGVAGNIALNLPDGIHPNAEGQKIVAENVWKAIKPIL
ncbi:MAG: arylesterase [Cyclobacteriaceae bacterium]|nr:arylesterase [Cyclobacteriaceae bacterium]